MTRLERRILKSQVLTLIAMSKSDETLVLSKQFQECLDKTEDLLSQIASSERYRANNYNNNFPKWQEEKLWRVIFQFYRKNWALLSDLEISYLNYTIERREPPQDNEKEIIFELVRSLKKRGAV